MNGSRLKFAVGEVIHHRRFDYRGVIIDADASFQLSEDWYDQVAVSRPPKTQPWYHVLVHGTDRTTYVAERHLEPDGSGMPVRHPLIADFFNEFHGGHYLDTRVIN
ncbi:MAG: heat shock protein HspQ [Acidobacteriota bacterium]